MSKDDTSKKRRPSLLLPIAGIALATPFLVWVAIGEVSIGSSHEYGPYDVGPESGYVVGGVAAINAAVAIAVMVIRTRQGAANWWSWAVVALLVGAEAVGAYGWRVLTGGYNGAPLGIAIVSVVWPPLIAAPLVAAVWFAWGGGHLRLRWTWLLTVVAVLVAPALFAVMGALL